MKKLLLALVLTLIPSVALAQIVVTPPTSTTTSDAGGWTRTGTNIAPTVGTDTLSVAGKVSFTGGMDLLGNVVFGNLSTLDVWGGPYSGWGTASLRIVNTSSENYSGGLWVVKHPATGVANANLTASGGYAYTYAADATNYASLTGGSFQTDVYGSGTYGYLYGTYTYASINNAGVATNLLGVDTAVSTYNTATTTTAAALRISNYFNDTSTTTNGYGLYIRTPTKAAGATLTNNYGIKVEDQNVGATNWAIKTGLGTVSFGDTVVVGRGATGAGQVQFLEDSDNGTNAATLVGPASTADVTITLPAVTGTVQVEAYGDLYIDSDAGTTFTLDATAGTYEQFPTFTVGTASSNVTLSATTDDITVTVAGKYKVEFNVSGTGGNNDEYIWQLYKEGVAVPACKFVRTMGSSAVDGAASFGCIVTASANDSFDVRATNATDGDDFTVHYANLRVTRIGS